MSESAAENAAGAGAGAGIHVEVPAVWAFDADRSSVLPVAKRGARLLNIGYVVPRLVLPAILVGSLWGVFQGLETHAWFERHLYALGFLDRSYSSIKAAKLELYEYVLGNGRQSLEQARLNSAIAHKDLSEARRRIDNHDIVALVNEAEKGFAATVEAQLTAAQSDAERLGDKQARALLKDKLLTTGDQVSYPLVTAHLQNTRDMMFNGEKFRERLQETAVLPALIALLATFLGLLFWLTRAYLKQRELSAQALRRSEAQIKFLIDNIHDGLAIVDGDGEIEGTNRGLLTILGAAGDGDLIGKPLSRILGSDIEQTLDALEDSAMTVVQERQAVGIDGRSFPAEVAIKEVRTMDGASRVVSLRDMTQKKQLERWKQDMVAIVSHDLRTPLTSMRGALGLVSSGALGALPAEAQAKLEAAQSNALGMIKLINDLLDLEKLEAAVEPPQPEVVKVAALIGAACEAARPSGSKRGVSLKVEPVSEDQQVVGDSDLLERMLGCLLDNAIKFSPAETEVRVEVSRSGQWLEIKISDCGRGIPPQSLDAVFLRMKQVQAEDRAGGNGLGLPLAKAIAHLHGGVIGLDSNPGRGTVAWVLLQPAALVVEPAPSVVAELP